MATTETQAPEGAETSIVRTRTGTGNGHVELLKFLNRPLEYLTELGHGNELGLVPFQFGNLPCHLVTKPEYIKAALYTEDWPPITRGRLARLKNWYGGGLFITHGPSHHRQRDEVWKPLFEDGRIPEATVRRVARHVEGWRDGDTVEVFSDFRALIYRTDWELLTGTELDSYPGVLDALETGVKTLAWLPLPFSAGRWRSPLPHAIRARRARERLDELVDRMIAERRNGKHDDLLTQIVAAAVSDTEARATFKMYFGADQNHALITWTFYALSQTPAVEARWHEELESVLGDRDPTVDDVDRMPYTRKILRESMRLYPPVWGFFRQMYGDLELGDQIVPDGHLMGMSTWVTHRDPRLWPDPLRFDPERWEQGAPRPPEVSYFPFSGGPYECHGKNLAWNQAVLQLATIGRRWKLQPVSTKPPRAFATWATEPKGGLEMRVSRR